MIFYDVDSVMLYSVCQVPNFRLANHAWRVLPFSGKLVPVLVTLVLDMARTTKPASHLRATGTLLSYVGTPPNTNKISEREHSKLTCHFL